MPMKNLKLFLLIFVSIWFFISSVNAVNCNFDGMFYDCTAWQTCQWPSQCECDGSMINPWDICSTPCPFDGSGYICSAGEYCTWPSQCECSGFMINGWEACNPSPIPPTASCSYLWQTIYSGQTMNVYQASTVSYTWSCGWLTLTCKNVWGVWILSPSYIWYNFSSCIVLPPPTWSCSLPWWGTIASGSSVTAYNTNSVACGSTCTSQTRTCSAWILDGYYSYQSCSVNSCGWGWGWGWSSTSTCELEDLICVDWIYEKKSGVNCRNWDLGETCELSWSDIDDKENDKKNDLSDIDLESFDKIWDISHSPYSKELNLAYLYAYNMWITDMDTIFKVEMEWNLIRAHMAKMLVEWSKNVMWLRVNTGINCDFDDIDGLRWQDLYYFVIESCQMWLMWLDSQGSPVDKFNPYDIVNRAQFGTVLSRAIWWDYYNGWDPFYNYHLDALNDMEIMNNISAPWEYELRWYVMLMLYRAHQEMNK